MSLESSAKDGSSPNPLLVRTMHDGAFELLRRWILNGWLEPGCKLPIRELAQGLGLSTMPVRDALVRLETTGLVTQKPHRGALVTELSLQDLRDFYGVRKVLEPHMAQEGAERLNSSERNRLTSIMDRMIEANAAVDVVQAMKLDEEFLSVVYSMTGNVQMEHIIQSVWARVTPYKLLNVTTAGADACRLILQSNEKLYAACCDKDGAAAAEVVRSTLDLAQDLLESLLRNHQRVRENPGAASIKKQDQESLASLCGRLLAEGR